MKNNLGVLIGMLAIVSVVGIVIFGKETTVVYENLTQPANEPVVETPAWMQDEDAVKAAEAVVKRKALEAENAALDEQIKTLETRQAEIEKELGF
jgi:hypothetical protein